MTRIEKIMQQIQRLTAAKLAAFRDRFRRNDSDTWDRQIERDIVAGKFDNLAAGVTTAELHEQYPTLPADAVPAALAYAADLAS